MSIRFLISAVLLCAAPMAYAQPWAQGVSEADKERARTLLDQGNNQLLMGAYRDALAAYEQAIDAWDHPAIRFNMVRALINLDRLVEAADNLDRALAYGAAPLEEQVYAEALNYRRLLEAQLGTLELRCDQDDVVVTVDGRPFATCPAMKTARVPPGPHAVVGTRVGFLTSTRDVLVLPGKTVTELVALRSIADATVTRSRWASWKPWAVAGGGVALAGLGGLVQLRAQSDLDRYHDEIDRLCGGTGCAQGEIPGPVDDLASRALVENRVALAMIGTGAAVAVTGVVLVVMNRPRTFVAEATPSAGAVTGITLTGRF